MGQKWVKKAEEKLVLWCKDLGGKKGVCGKWKMLACAIGSLLTIQVKNRYAPHGFCRSSRYESYKTTRFPPKSSLLQLQKWAPWQFALYQSVNKPLIPLAGSGPNSLKTLVKSFGL